MFRKFFTGIVSFGFSVVFLAFLVLLALNQTLFDQDFYRTDLVPHVHQFLSEELPLEFDLEKFPIEIGVDNVREVFSEVFTVEVVKSEIGAAVDEFLAVEVDGGGSVELPLPLRWISERDEQIAGGIAAAYVDGLEVCADEDDKALDYSCVPQDLAKVDVANRIEFDLLRVMFVEFPTADYFPVRMPRFVSGNVAEYFDGLMLKVLILSFFLMVVFLLLGFWLVHDFKKSFKYLAESLLSAGFLASLYLYGFFQLESSFDSAALTNLADTVAELLVNHIFVYLIFVLLLGLGFLLISFKDWFQKT